ncbi:MAG: aminotransferase class IV [Parafilimonas sp.]|nr:aminotransferase class IV [Parafilimonas sp.]
MESGNHFCFNGKILLTGKLIISADNRCFRFGDGFFETMKMVDENIALYKYHFERLFSSLQLLKFETPDYFTAEYLLNQIKIITKKNNHTKAARIRLTIFRGNGGLFDYENNFANYTIQTWQLDPAIALNKKGLITGIYTKARKAIDDFSHIKSNNYLPSVMAAMWSKENKLDDAIILNTNNRLAEATIANIFLMKDGKVKTPSLSEGCVNGVMRKYVIECLKKENIPFEETKVEADELAEASELFTTNAIQEIKWVQKCNKFNYGREFSKYLHHTFIQSLHKHISE